MALPLLFVYKTASTTGLYKTASTTGLYKTASTTGLYKTASTIRPIRAQTGINHPPTLE